jgi:glycosyltransferase involved in cell wall biosynthesis
MKKLAILIPSYKRPEVLEATLAGLLNNTAQGQGYDIRIAIGLNQASAEDIRTVNKYSGLFKGIGIALDSIPYANNIGKANILNVLYKIYGYQSDLIITMDNDMVILKPWLHLIGQCDSIDYDIMGFCSAQFWAHDPVRENCSWVDMGDHKFYTIFSVAGGMMLFHHQFLNNHPWTNHGGVYGRDDASMCLITQKKYVLHSEEDWLIHDPLNSSTPELKAYEDKKKELYLRGTTVFHIGWDET